MGALEQGTFVTGSLLQGFALSDCVSYSHPKNESRVIPYAQFVDASLDSLTWYDLLPGDGVLVSGLEDSPSAAEIADQLLTTAIDDIDQIDLLAARLLNGCASIDAYPAWPELSLRLSKTMSRNLTATGSRSLRMRTQRLIYYLQTIIDSDRNDGFAHLLVSEKKLGGNKPWDYLQQADAEWWLTSDKNNIHQRCADGTSRHWSLGLPTQIDPLTDGRIAIGSLYTREALLTDGEDWEVIKHEAPVVLVFEHGGKRLFLDHFGVLWQDQPRRQIMSTERPQVHFARHFDAVVYLLDNGDFGHISTVDLITGSVNRIPVLPVQVCNDLVSANGAFYLIDKQQGSVFKFNQNWEYQSRALLFGRGKGCLQDPVAIRAHRDRLQVVSWLSGQLTELKCF